MFTKTLSKKTKRALALLGDSHLLGFAYLAGGTACALQIGHRISIDLDFFTPKKFDAKQIIQSLKAVGKFELEQQSWGTILGTLDDVRFSLFLYEYPVLFSFKTFHGIHIADLRDIAAMKIDAIASRGLKRDFVDLYFLCKNGLSLKEMLGFYGRKYVVPTSHFLHLQKSLVYFTDADVNVMPKMLKTGDWKTIKKFFETEVKELS